MAAPGSGPAPGGRGDGEELSGRWGVGLSDGERCGKPMENRWKTYGKHMENHGKLWKTRENLWKTMENSGKNEDRSEFR